MASSWQPISTAPKDGTAILTFQTSKITGDKMRVAYWRDDTVPKGWSPREDSPLESFGAMNIARVSTF